MLAHRNIFFPDMGGEYPIFDSLCLFIGTFIVPRMGGEYPIFDSLYLLTGLFVPEMGGEYPIFLYWLCFHCSICYSNLSYCLNVCSYEGFFPFIIFLFYLNSLKNERCFAALKKKLYKCFFFCFFFYYGCLGSLTADLFV